MAALFLTFIVSMFMIKYITIIFRIPFSIWFYVLSALLVWSCVQYTGYWEDYMILAIFISLGLLLKYFSISRAAFIIGFVLSDQIEKMYYQYTTLFNWYDVFIRPISLTLIVITGILVIYGIFFNKTRITYT
jgi:TctA family transporter